MSYIGNNTQNINYVPAVDFFSGDGSTVAFTLSRPVASYPAIQVVIANVPQNPGSAYTVSGSTITFTSAPPSGTNNIYVYYTSPNTTIVQPGQGTVQASLGYTPVNPGAATAYTRPQYITAQALTSGASVDASLYQSWTADANGSTFTVANPTNGITGCYYALYVTFTTANTVSFGSNFKGITNYTPTATAGAVDNLVFRFDGTYFDCTGYATNIKA